MASFSAYMAADSARSADFAAYFSGGDSSYSRYRYVELTISGFGTYTFDSDSAGGANSSFSYYVWGLTPNTTYSWSVVMGYYAGPGATEGPTLTSYSDSGSFTTPAETGPYIWNGSEWKPATPYIWNGTSWVQATANIWDGSSWQS